MSKLFNSRFLANSKKLSHLDRDTVGMRSVCFTSTVSLTVEVILLYIAEY